MTKLPGREFEKGGRLDPGDGKLGERLAYHLEAMIIREGLEPGDVIGTESRLLDEFGVSRATFREAARILEHHAAARMKRGAGGGLVVTEPTPRAIVAAASYYLQFEGASAYELYEARSALELYAVRRAMERGLTEVDKQRLIEVVDAPDRQADPEKYIETNPFHAVTTQLAGNRALSLFVDVLRSLTAVQRRGVTEGGAEAIPSHELAEDVAIAHRRIVDAMIAGDTEAACLHMERHLRAIPRRLSPSPGSSGAS